MILDNHHHRKINYIYIWMCLKMLCTPTPNGFADHYPVFKWLFHWGYIPFSDIPKFVHDFLLRNGNITGKGMSFMIQFYDSWCVFIILDTVSSFSWRVACSNQRRSYSKTSHACLVLIAPCHPDMPSQVGTMLVLHLAWSTATPRSTLSTAHLTLHIPTPHTGLHTPRFTHHTSNTLHVTLPYALHRALHTPHLTLHTPQSGLHTLHPHSTIYTPHFTVHTPLSTIHTLHPTQFTLRTPHFRPHTLHSTPETPHSSLYAPNSRLHASHSTRYIPHQHSSTLHTPQPALLPIPHSTVYTGTVTGKECTRLVKYCNLVGKSALCDCIRFRWLVLFDRWMELLPASIKCTNLCPHMVIPQNDPRIVARKMIIRYWV